MVTAIATKPDHINQENWENLIQTRGLDPAWTSANCKSIDIKEASEFLHQQTKSNGLLIGGEHSPQQQFKPDKPWSDKQGKKAPKYRTPVGDDYDAILPTDPNDPSYWTDIEKLKERAYKIDGIPYLIITEGGLKAIPGCSNSYPTIGLCGVEMGLTSGKKDPQGKRYLIPTLERFAKHGFGFIFAFDADCARKKEVINAEIKLADALERVSDVSVYSITGTWEEPAGKGMDDYIQNHGIEEFRKRLIEAELVRQKYRSNDGGNNKQNKPPRAGEIGKELAEKYRDRWVYCSELNSWLVYELDKTGVWELVSDDYISHAILIELEAKELDKFRTNSYVNNIIGYLKDKLFIRSWDEQSHRFLPFKNGVYELATGKLHEHSPGFRLTWRLERDYSVIENNLDATLSFLSQLAGGNSRNYQILLYFMAAVLRGRYDLQKFLYLIGTGGTGKSTYTQLLTLLVGETNTATSSLEELEDKHNIIDLFGKRLLTLPDQAPISTRKNGNFKRLTGGDYLSGRRLFKDTASFQFKGLALVTSNPPFIFPASTANWLNRRMLMVECNTIIPKRDRDSRLLEKMEAELPALTNYLLSIPEEDIEKVLTGVDEPELTASAWEYQCQSDGLAAWINDELIEDPNAIAPIGSDGNKWKGQDYDPESSTFYASYCNYCRETGRQPKTPQTFSSDLIEVTYRLLGWNVAKERKRYAGKPQRVLKGVRLRTDSDGDVPTVAESLERDNREQPVTTPVTTSQGSQKFDEMGSINNRDNRDNLKQEKSKSNLKTSTSEVSQNESKGVSRLKGQNKNVSDEAGTVVTPNSDFHIEQDSGCHAQTSKAVTGCHGIDYSSYPSRDSDDYRHKEKRANKCKEQMLACQTKEALETFKAEGGFSQDEIKWVWDWLMTAGEKERVTSISKTAQQSLEFDNSDRASPKHQWVKPGAKPRGTEDQLTLEQQQEKAKDYLRQHGESEEMVIALETGLPSATMRQILEPIAECTRRDRWERHWKLKE